MRADDHAPSGSFGDATPHGVIVSGVRAAGDAHRGHQLQQRKIVGAFPDVGVEVDPHGSSIPPASARSRSCHAARASSTVTAANRSVSPGLACAMSGRSAVITVAIFAYP